jgi:suppressor for copper-sensitivity B
LQFRLEPGWKIYWRSPGDAGYPPTVDWEGSTNLSAATWLWPTPGRFDVSGLTTLGYKGEVALPIQIRLTTPGQPLTAVGKLDYLTCDDVCIPYTAEFTLALPAGPGAPSAEAPLIGAWLAKLPVDGAAGGLAVESATLSATPPQRDSKEPGVALHLTLRSGAPFAAAPDVVVEGEKILTSDAPKVVLGDGGRRVQASVPLIGEKLGPAALAGKPLTLTVIDGARGVELAASATVGPPPATPAGEGLLAMLAVALLGGLILNLMPCVLPVLAIKVAGVLGAGGAARPRVRAEFLSSAAGVVISFLVLAGAAIAAKSAGAAVGWGVQFQQPVFLAFMIAVVALFAANLAGLFEIPMPAWMGDAAVAGENAAGGGSLAGHFVGGAFATLLATPCSAPFVGTALSFALARGPGEILAIFAAMGVGLALPYLAVAAFPGLAARLPRPGRWMLKVKAVLALLLLATAIWLLTVLHGVAGWPATIAVGGLAFVMGAGFAAGSRYGRPAALVGALAGALAVVAPTLIPASAPLAAVDPKALWTRMDATKPLAAQIEAALAAGKPVLVDVTADWCVTCQVNKKAVLDAAAIRGRIERGEVIALRADWTRPSAEIAAYLKGFGRYGIPFNAAYGPRAPQGLPLSELLTTSAVEEALAKASGR